MANQNEVTLSLVLPAYNEQDNIENVVGKCKTWLESNALPWEIIVIDNCSKDRTAALVEGMSKVDPRIRLVKHETNRLYSGSCRSGMEAARGKYIAIMDSDDQYHVQDLTKMMKKIDSGFNLVFGWRVKRQDPVMRKVFSLVFNTLGKIILGYRFHDLNCGFRMFDRTFVEKTAIQHRINMVNPEMYVRCLSAGLKTAELPIGHEHRTAGETSHNFSFKRNFQILAEVVRYMKTLSHDLPAKPQLNAAFVPDVRREVNP